MDTSLFLRHLTLILIYGQGGLILFQIYFFIERPSDKRRFWYLALLSCLFINAVTTHLYNGSTSEDATLLNLSSLLTAICFGYFFYRVFNFSSISKYLGEKYSMIFCFLPFAIALCALQLLSNEHYVHQKMHLFVPLIYSAITIYTIGRKFLSEKQQESSHWYSSWITRSAFLTMVLWSVLPSLKLIDGLSTISDVASNSAIMIMGLVYVGNYAVLASRDNKNLLESSIELQKKIQADDGHLRKIYQVAITPLDQLDSIISNTHRPDAGVDVRITQDIVQRLRSRLTDFYDLTRLDRQQPLYNHSCISDFSSLLRRQTDSFSVFARSNELVFESDIEPDLLVEIHPAAVERIFHVVLRNFLLNLSAGNRIELSLTSTARFVFLAFQHDGKSIPSELQGKIFEPFSPLYNSPGNEDYGMALVKRIAHGLNGKLVFKSDPESTELVITLNRFKGSGDLIPHVYQHWPLEFSWGTLFDFGTSQLSNEANILIIDDDKLRLEYLVSKVSLTYRVSGANDVREAAKWITDLGEFDLIISSDIIDSSSEFQIVRNLLSVGPLRETPVIFLSSNLGLRDKWGGDRVVDVLPHLEQFSDLAVRVQTILEDDSFSDRSFDYPKDLAEVNFTTAFKRYRLTTREVEVIDLMMKGKTSQEIAESLNITLNTVKRHLKNVRDKLGVSSKRDIIQKLLA